MSKAQANVLAQLRTDSIDGRTKDTLFKVFLRGQTRDVQDAIAEAKDDVAITSSAIHRYVTSLGYTGHVTTVTNWRKSK